MIYYSMAKPLQILTIEDKKQEGILREKSIPVAIEELKDKEFNEFIEDLLYTAQHSEDQGNVPAGGISAIQVGKKKRVFYSLNYDTDQWELFINPTVEPDSFLKITTEEGCLSIPNITGDVSRYYKIRIKYQDINGNWISKRYRDINAVSIQHEFDHLEGVLFTDKISKKN
jgi:peptide deformylase